MKEYNLYDEFTKRGISEHSEHFIEFLAYEKPENITSSRVYILVKKESDITGLVDEYFNSKYLLLEYR